MMNFNSLYKVLLLIIFTSISFNSVHADGLGRLFTSENDRKKLERVRHAKEEIKKPQIVKVEEILEPVVEEKVSEPVIRDVITLKGIVHRGDGKNTAWLNDSNTFEGDLESQYIQVNNDEIKPGHVELVMPDNETKVKVKVGEYYDPSLDAGN